MTTKPDTTFDPSRRSLCPDGSCIGLIGSDGRCSVCGMLASEGTGEIPAAIPPALPTPQPESRGEPAGSAGGGPAREAERSEAAFDPNRRLCPDDACIGVIGSNNKCGVCGRRG